MLTWLENQKKRCRCSLTIEELFERYDNRDNILRQLEIDYNKRQKLSSFIQKR